MLLCCLTVAFLNAQSTVITFTGRDSINHHIPLSRVVVSNLTKGWQETLLWPDTVLMMSATGIGEVETQNFASLRLSQNNPNPFDGTTFVNMQVAEPGDVSVEITDIAGRIVETFHETSLQPGCHSLRITLSSPGIYFLTARQDGRTASVKMANRGNGGSNVVTVVGIVETFHETSLPQSKNAHRGATDNPFDAGDRMEYVGYAVINGEEVESSHVAQAQNASQTVVLTFSDLQSDGQPCLGTPTVTDHDGNVYNTVQIGDQCWTRENMRVTHYSDGTPIPAGADYSYTTPYYYDYSSSGIPLSERGYLYNWPAAMHSAASSSAVPSGVQGVCPVGWHLPSDAEWTVLTDYVSSVSEYQCGNSNNIAKALASTTGWNTTTSYCVVGNDQGTNNASGFGAVPAGYWKYGFLYAGYDANFWSSTELNSYLACYRYLYYNDAYVTHDNYFKYSGFSVRCLRD